MAQRDPCLSLTVKDRVVQTATKLIIEPIFEVDFEHCSYGFRPKRKRIRQVVDHRRPVKIERIIEELEPVIRGWVNYFRMANSSWKFGKIKFYVAQRIRRRREKTGYGYKQYPDTYLYGRLGLYNDYRVSWTKAF